MQSMLGIASYSHWLGFSAYAVRQDAPFLSETGFRSFLGVHAPLWPDMDPKAFAEAVIASYVRDALGGRLLRIRPLT